MAGLGSEIMDYCERNNEVQMSVANIFASSIKLLIPVILLSPHLKLCLFSTQNQEKRLGEWLLFESLGSAHS